MAQSMQPPQEAVRSPSPAPQAQEPLARVAGETVTVACKMPNGLILRCFGWVDYDEPVMGGGVKAMKRAVPLPETYTLNGSAVPRGGQAIEQEFPIVGGYALTSGIPVDFWNAWYEANKTSALVKNNIVFAQPREERARGEAREKKTVRSGLEPIDPENPGLHQRGIGRGQKS